LPNPLPHLLGCERHVEIGDAEGRERIERRADHRRGRADGIRFPAALSAARKKHNRAIIAAGVRRASPHRRRLLSEQINLPDVRISSNRLIADH
jgi:hypothetical protein